MAADAKRQLVEFVIKRAFDLFLKAAPNGRSDADRKKIEHVQDATRSAIERYWNYGSAEEVVVNFRRISIPVQPGGSTPS